MCAPISVRAVVGGDGEAAIPCRRGVKGGDATTRRSGTDRPAPLVPPQRGLTARLAGAVQKGDGRSWDRELHEAQKRDGCDGRRDGGVLIGPAHPTSACGKIVTVCVRPDRETIFDARLSFQYGFDVQRMRSRGSFVACGVGLSRKAAIVVSGACLVGGTGHDDAAFKMLVCVYGTGRVGLRSFSCLGG